MSQAPPRQLNRWIRASVVKHFRLALKTEFDYETKSTVFVEGEERETDELKHWLEIRTDGPYVKKRTLNLYRVRIEVNILANTLMDSHASIYHIDDMQGMVSSLFRNCIPVYRYGNAATDPANDGTLIDTLELRREGGEEVECTYFGKVRPDTALEQATVEGHYEGHWQL